jgi:hypothetical protein
MKGDFTRFSDDPSKHYSDVLQQQGRVQLDADWNAQRAIDRGRLRADTTAMVGAAGMPWADPGFAILPTADGRGLTIGVGTLYVGGVLCRNDMALALDAQPNAPGQGLPPAAGRFLVYLDVWDRHVTALQDAALRDPALGGPDTTTRIQTLWQVRTIAVDANATGDAFSPGWAPPGSGSTGRMKAEIDPATAGSACALPTYGGYTALSNQLYRVEIHNGGTPGSQQPPTFKWSRDNGIVVSAVSAITGQTITVADIGPDDTLSFTQGQLVELLRPEDELNGIPGALLLVQTVQPETGAVIIDGATPLPSWAAVPMSRTGVLLRRWDMAGAAATATAGGILLQSLPIALEAGLSVSFDPAGHYQPGDYWLVPARAIPTAETGNILWFGGAQPALGISHRYASLALVDRKADGTFSLFEDLRTLFEPLTGRVQPFVLSAGTGGAIPAIGASLTTDQLAAGLRLTTSTALEAVSVSPASVQLLADVPVTIGQVLALAGLPQGTNPNRVAGTQPVSLACGLNISGRTITVTPDSVAMDLLHASLAGATSEPFATFFSSASDGDWSINQDGSVTFAAATSLEDNPPVTALSYEPPPSAIGHLAVALSPPPQWGQPGAEGLAGLVFNATDGSGYWAFYYFCRLTASGTGAAQPNFGFGIANYTGATSAPAKLEIAGSSAANAVLTLDVAATSSGLSFGYRIGGGAVTQLNFGTSAGTAQIPKSFLAGGQVGILAAGVKGTIFRDLGWISAAGSQTAILPVGATAGVTVRLVVRASELRRAVDGPPKLIEAAAAPAPDFQASFQVTAPSGSYSGSAYAFFAGLGAFGSGKV